MKLSIENLSFNYGNTNILSDVDLVLEKKELVAVLGSNGVGKTTLLKCINRLLKPSCGRVMILGDDIQNMSLNGIAQNISYVSQKMKIARLNVYDAVMMGRKPYMKFAGITKHDHDMVVSIIHRLELVDLALRYIDELSGGELQKVCIARALVQEPEIMLLDEPISALDLKNQLEIMDIVREIVDSHNIIAVMTIHDINTAIRYAHKLVFLKHGEIYKVVKPIDITNDIIRDVYGINSEIMEINGNKFVYPLSSIKKNCESN